nr:ribosome biogenesis GTPase Der [Desulfobacterales bacterium]
MKPIVAIVGRPNVGKSTFFNRVSRSRKAIVDNFPGVTRDRIYADVRWKDAVFVIVDTGGFSSFDEGEFVDQVRYQVIQAIEESDAIVMILDGRDDLTPLDFDLIQLLRKADKPVFYVINKIDSPKQEMNISDFFRLGVDSFYPISAEHGYGVDTLLDDVVSVLPRGEPEASEEMIKLAVVGRPNVGKSSLVNQLLGQERVMVSEIPGTTRDAIDTVCRVDDTNYLLIDTAGIRRKGRVRKKLEKFSVVKALKSIDRCHIALIVLDAVEKVTDQDTTIAGYAFERGKGCIILFNKWDLVKKDVYTFQEYKDEVKHRFRFLSFAPILSVSALTGQRVDRIFKLAKDIYEQYSTRISTGTLNRALADIVTRFEPPRYRNRPLKLFYATQVSIRPPTFVCFVNYPEGIHFSYERYMINQFRESLGLDSTPIRLIFRKKNKK